MIRVGIVGLGFMGRMHYRCWKTQPGATIAAILRFRGGALEGASLRSMAAGMDFLRHDDTAI